MKARYLFIVSTIVTIQLLGNVAMLSAQMTTTSVTSNDVEEFVTILLNGTFPVPNCTTINIVVPRVQYLMYNHQNPNGYTMRNFNNVDYSKGVYILLYGWLGNRDVDYIKVIRDAYLQRFDTNVITVDFPDAVSVDYGTAICNLPAIGQNIANFMCILDQYYNLSKLHIVGHSYGAHLAASASLQLYERCHLSVGRITGLDPAGPGFQDQPLTHTLDATDANFVDIIHTNHEQFGYVGNAGDIDFYVNCGYFQPGCPTLNEYVTPSTNLTGYSMRSITCNHQRSCFLFAESILKNDFLASSRLSPMLCITTDNSTDRVYMGQYCYSPQQSHNYYVDTNSNPPYGMGPNGPLH